MDFGTLLHTAQKNEKFAKKEPVRYYSTKFEPPKKEQRNKQLSENIKKFLAKKELEEKAKKQEADKRKEELFALRAKDKKATRRVNVMLKRTKSANQSVMQDAVDKDNTAVTLAGPLQPDEDDYGYVSQEAAAFYNKMVEKYNKTPTEPKFSLDKKKKSGSSLNSTKDRVRAALEREKEEANMPHKRRRKHAEEDHHHEESVEEEPVKKKRPGPPPPTLNFNDLLKLAEKKQFEPIVIEQKPKEEERLLTKKQKKEMEREKEWRDRREGKLPPAAPPNATNRIPKLNQEKTNRPSSDPKTAKPSETVRRNSDIVKKPPQLPVASDKKVSRPIEPPQARPKLLEKKYNRENVPSNSSKPQQISKSLPPPRPAPKVEANKSLKREMGKPKEFPPRDLMPKRSLDSAPKQFPPRDLKPKQFPPADVRRKDQPIRKPNKRRILDDDDEEYDSEMDDFIDDGPEESEDYSKYISEIFGYDKSKYRYIDDDVDNMESSFAQQMREEAISKKIGIMEDLEDMKMEEEEKRLKALRKKRK